MIESTLGWRRSFVWRRLRGEETVDQFLQRTSGESMTNDKAVLTTRERIGDVAPKLADLTEKVLFGDIWERPGLSKRDRSVITVSALVAMNRTEQLPFHLRRALENGVTRDELVELITHLAFYAGWPCAVSALSVLRKTLSEATP
jgi:4-carboxymuconolactone decarboxylase